MNLNNKGYMLVEIIVSFALAFAIIISLTNLVLKFKDTSQDLFYETKYLKDKTLIIRNIMEDLEEVTITKTTIENNNTIKINYRNIDETGEIITGTKAININGNTIKYGNFTTNFVTNDKSYYTKVIEPSLMIGNLKNCSNLRKGYFCATIEVTSMYNEENYDLTFFSTNIRYDI